MIMMLMKRRRIMLLLMKEHLMKEHLMKGHLMKELLRKELLKKDQMMILIRLMQLMDKKKEMLKQLPLTRQLQLKLRNQHSQRMQLKL
jgi:hypothetical protein